MPALTLDRLLASIGFGSRKEARALVRMGLVELDGNVLDDPFMELKERPENITVNGEEVPTVEKLYVMLHKPVDFECSHHPRDHRSVYELLPDRFSAMGIQSAGRLDADSSGIILFSNQGDFIHKVESPKKGCLKRYRVTLAREFVREEGSVVITIGEGLYHQVRRMFAAVGNHVETLERISIGPVVLDESLGEGGWRFLTEAEIASL